MYRGFSLRLLHQPQPQECAALFARASEQGANAVALVPHHYAFLAPGTPNIAPPPPLWYHTSGLIYPDVGQDIAHPFQNTPSDDLVYWIAHEAQAQGLQVMLKPHLDSYYGAWRGYISVQARAAKFRTAYRAFLHRYIRVAKSLDDPILCMGCELYTVTKELGAAFWADMAAWVRSRYGGNYSGRLTYAANWGFGDDAEYNRLTELWPSLDYVGVDAYFPLVFADEPPSPSYEELLRMWDTSVISWESPPSVSMLGAAQKAQRPLLFTEIGLSNYTRAAGWPGEDARPGALRDDQLQADYYRAFRHRFDPEPQYAGFFCWELGLGPQQAISHAINDRPAELVAFREEG